MATNMKKQNNTLFPIVAPAPLWENNFLRCCTDKSAQRVTPYKSEAGVFTENLVPQLYLYQTTIEYAGSGKPY